MLAKITLYDGTIYKIADKTTDTEDGIYLGRIKDELSLVSAMQEAGNAPAIINLTIINDDDFIPHSKDLWAADVMLTNDNGVSWRGKINFCNFDADGNLYVTASEKTAPELELQLPDEVRQVYTIDEDFHLSSVTMTIPLVIGGTHEKPILVPTILIDKTQGIYLICVGEIREVVAVYSGAEKLPLSEYMPWRGTAEQPYHKGFAYVAIASGKRLNADGSYAEINVEVVGLKLGDFTEEECRNGALFLYYFLTTAATGINGWGCGIDQSEIDTASFQSAITLCNQLGYKLDGIMWLRQSAQSWIDQICQAIHGKYSINANGKRSLFIDYAGNASKKTFTASNMRVDKYGKNSYTSVVYNKGILSYDYNPITGLFMQSAQYENAESIAQIGEQKFVGESYLIKDPTTALAVLEYTCKRSQTAAEAIEFKTDDIDTLLRAGDVITINRPDLSINNALYQIQNISITDYEASISAVKFDTSVFIVSGTPSSVNWGNDKAITPALTPAQATNLLLSTGFDINPDGTGTPYISGTFTVPDGGWLAAAVQYGIGANPNNWTELALITEGKFKLSPVNVGTVYSVRVRMITATGHSDYITGQITATGDTIPPAEPTIAVKATDKTVTVQCGLDNPPYDMGGFQVYRKKSTEQVYTLIGSVAANRGYASFTDYVDEYVTYNYIAKSYDRSGNLSTNFSNVASVTVTGIQANDVAATALAMPTGSILRLSAKNCTTASIAETNGAKDVSGNGNHGKAEGGVSVVFDEDLGECFDFNGTTQVIKITDKKNTVFISQNAYTFVARFKLLSKPTKTAWSVIFWCHATPRIIISLNKDYKFIIASDNGFDEITINKVAEIGVVYNVIVSANYLEGWRKIYIDGVEVASQTKTGGALTINISYLWVGKGSQNTENFIGRVSDVRIYPRALSASEIKTLYMFPDDVTFGQMTADLIGANVIKASNLVLTENIITTNAQIKQAVIDNMTITGNANFIAEQQARAQVQTNLNTVTTNIYSPNTTTINGGKITTGTIQAAAIAANAITAEKLNVAALKAPSGCVCYINAQGMAAGVYSSGTVADSSGHQRKANIRGSVQIYDKNVSAPAFFTWKNGQQGSLWTAQEVWGTQYLTFEVWLFPTNYTDTTNHAIVTNYPNALRVSGISIYQNKLKLRAFVKDTGDANECDISLTAGSLTQVVLEYNAQSGSLTWFVNGVQRNTIVSDGNKQTMSTANANIIINAPIYNNYYAQNEIVSVRVYKRILSATEIKTLYMLGTDTESGTITADRIAAGCVETRHLTADAIVGKTFQTASNTGTSNAAGVRFNSSGIQGFNGSAKKFDLNTNGKLTCSDVDLTGKITATSGTIGKYSLDNGWFTYADNSSSVYSGLKMIDTFITFYIGRSGSYKQQGYLEASGFHSTLWDGSGHITREVEADTDSANTIVITNGKGVATNGWSTGCDENIKKDIKDISTLEKLKGIRVKKFKYSQKAIQEKLWQKDQTLKREGNLKKGIKTEEEKMPEFKDDENAPDYIMAMAGEFNKAFGVDNGNEESINYTNAIGVCMRAIQELAEQFDNAVLEIKELKNLLKQKEEETR